MKIDLAIILLLSVFFGTLVLGLLLIERLPLGYTEAALLYLSAVIATSAFWIGRNK